MILSKFRRDLLRHKTRVPKLSCGVVCVILRLPVLVQLVELRLVNDQQIDIQARDNSKYRAVVVSRGKNASIDFISKCKVL